MRTDRHVGTQMRVGPDVLAKRDAAHGVVLSHINRSATDSKQTKVRRTWSSSSSFAYSILKCASMMPRKRSECGRSLFVMCSAPKYSRRARNSGVSTSCRACKDVNQSIDAEHELVVARTLSVAVIQRTSSSKNVSSLKGSPGCRPICGLPSDASAAATAVSATRPSQPCAIY
jgi:hypothetical protein